MLYLFASDLHGHTAHYRAALRKARELGAAAVLLGGDLLPHARTHWPQLDYVRRELRRVLMDHRVQGGATVYAVPGNDDWLAVRSELAGLMHEGLLVLVDGATSTLPGGWYLVGYPCVPATPFYMKDYDRRDLPGDPPPAGKGLISLGGRVQEVDLRGHLGSLPSIAEELAALPVPARPERTIFLSHGPPYGTALDRLYDGRPIGSRALRAYLERWQPALLLCGHIHESPRVSRRYWDQIGSTFCVAAGAGEVPHMAWFDPAEPAATLQHNLYGGYGAVAGRF